MSTTSTTSTTSAAITNNIALPLNPTSVNVTNMGFSNNQAVATANNASISLVPIQPEGSQIFNSITSNFIYQPKAHSYLPNSSVNNILVDSTLVDNLNSNNYTEIDFDINNELVTLEINNGISLIRNIEISLTPLTNLCVNNSYAAVFFQYGNYMYILDANSNTWQIEFNSNGTIGNWTNLGIIAGNPNNDNGIINNSISVPALIFNNQIYLMNMNNNNIQQFSINNLGLDTSYNTDFTDFESGYSQITYFLISNNLYILLNSNTLSSGSINTIYLAELDTSTTNPTITSTAATSITFPYTSAFYKTIEINGLYFIFAVGTNKVYSPTVDTTTSTLSGFTLTGNLPVNFEVGHTPYVLNGTLYIFGVGSNNTNIYVGTLDSTTNTLTFTTSSLTTPLPVYGCAVGASSTNLYIFGSNTPSNYSNNSTNYINNYITSISYSGSSLLEVLPHVVLPNNVANALMLTANDYAYIIGGITATSTPISTVSLTYVNTQNGPGATITGTNLPIAMYDMMGVVVGSYVYLFGGNNGTDILDTIYQGEIQTNGNITNWTALSTTLPYAVAGAAICATDTNVYILGGYDYPASTTTTTALSTIISIPIETGDTLGTPVTLSGSNLPETMYYCSAIVANGIIYLAGGLNSSNDAITNVYNSLINSDGSINSFGNTGNSLPTNYGAGQLVLWNNFLYYFGSTNGNVYQAYLADNYFGPWLAVYNNLPTEWSNMMAIACNGYLFAGGGINDSNGDYLNNVYYYNLTDNNTYSLVPDEPLADLPNAIYLLGNLTAQALIGDLTSGDTLNDLTLANRSINSGTATFEYNPTFAADASTGGNAYFQLNNLNEGDTVITLSGVIGGTILPPTTSTTA